MLPGVTPAHKGLSPLGKIIPLPVAPLKKFVYLDLKKSYTGWCHAM
jgi:hypothetical protein